MKIYKELVRIESMKHKGKIYTIKEDERGDLSCSCPSWIFKKGVEITPEGKRICKHIRVLDKLNFLQKMRLFESKEIIQEKHWLGDELR